MCTLRKRSANKSGTHMDQAHAGDIGDAGADARLAPKPRAQHEQRDDDSDREYQLDFHSPFALAGHPACHPKKERAPKRPLMPQHR
jgi:hypothetical protein